MFPGWMICLLIASLVATAVFVCACMAAGAADALQRTKSRQQQAATFQRRAYAFRQNVVA